MQTDNEIRQLLEQMKSSQGEALEAMQRVEDLAKLALPLIQLQTFRLAALIGVLATDGARGAQLIAKYHKVLAAKTPPELLEADAAFSRAVSCEPPH